MGVSGSGKTHIGQLLAKALDISFIDADDYHSQSSIDKMSTGIPLTDADRYPWLDRLHQIAQRHLDIGCVIACSALKASYRQRLSTDISQKVSWIYLKGDFDIIYTRMQHRKDHFMGAEMLKSQFDTMEEPEDALVVNIEDSAEAIVSTIKNKLNMKAEIGVIGMGVMGKSLSRNLARNGFSIALYNRHVDGLEEDVAANFKSAHSELVSALAFDDLESFVESLASPRKILLMVNAGAAVDAVIQSLIDYLDPEDIILDAGNSHYLETNRRLQMLESKGIYFIGTGVSGGEKGALLGPSIMPSGVYEAYQKVEQYLTTIAAKDSNQEPCCTYVGRQGSGHFVKMIHNGIEYAEMQLLAECYAILKNQGMTNPQMADTMEAWKPDCDSYLLGITIDILRKKEAGSYLLDQVLDQAANKGTGKWATSTVADSGEAATMIPTALFARYLSAFKTKRQEAEALFTSNKQSNSISTSVLRDAYQFARIINHHQGFSLIDSVSAEHDWNVNLSEIARIWSEGCIIKSDLIKQLVNTFKQGGSIMFNTPWSTTLSQGYASIQSVVIESVQSQLHTPCLSEALSYFNGMKIGSGSANLIQAQRDYFGAHTYKRIDDPKGKSHHSDWTTTTD